MHESCQGKFLLKSDKGMMSDSRNNSTLDRTVNFTCFQVGDYRVGTWCNAKSAAEELGEKVTLRNQYSFCKTANQKNIELGDQVIHGLFLYV